MPYFSKQVKIPSELRYGTKEHKKTVQKLYRRTLKHLKQNTMPKFTWYVWDIEGHYARKSFERTYKLKDPGELNAMMKELTFALNAWEAYDPFFYPWDGPQSNSWQRHRYYPKFAYRYKDAMQMDRDEEERKTSEYFTKQECKKWQARYMVRSLYNLTYYPNIYKHLHKHLQYLYNTYLQFILPSQHVS